MYSIRVYIYRCHDTKIGMFSPEIGPTMISSAAQGDAETVARNLRRLMAQECMTFEEVVEASGLDERTVRALARAANNPHARTLHKLASGLGVAIDELLRSTDRLSSRRFDRATNSLIDGIVTTNPNLFANWCDGDFDELYSRFGVGGHLTESGVLAEAQAMNIKRDICRRVNVVLESGEAELLRGFVELLYSRATATQSAERRRSVQASNSDHTACD
jgi:transcriptional regulator with XRE-family HTH domain